MRRLLTVAVADVTLGEPASGEAQMLFTLTRDGDLSQSLGVRYFTEDRTAKAGLDYVAASGIAFFGVGNNTTQVAVTIKSDAVVDPKEFFVLKLGGIVDSPASFSPTVNFGANSGPTSEAVGDFNGDGKIDILVGHNTTNAISILLNTTASGSSTASFATKQDLPVEGRPSMVTVGDFNGDGKPDVAAATLYGGDVAVMLNVTPTNSTTISFLSAQRFSVGLSPFMARTVDMNQDGKLDIVTLSNPDKIAILLNTTPQGATTPTFAAVQTFTGPANGPRSLAIDDFNGDGKPDVASSSNYGKVTSVLLSTTVAGSSTMSFAPKVDLPVGHLAHQADAGDLNGDGKPDLAVAGFNDMNVTVFTNTAATGATVPSFADPIVLSTAKRPEGIALVDVTNDGKLDIVVTQHTDAGQTIIVFRNTTNGIGGTPTFDTGTSFGVAAHPSYIVSADFNADGLPDLAVANNWGNNVSVLLNRSPQIGDNIAKGTISERPTISGLGAEVSYVAGGAPVVLSPGAAIADLESEYANSQIAVQVTNATASDRLSIVPTSAVTVSGNLIKFNGTTVATLSGGTGATPLLIAFNASASKYIVQTILRRVGFSVEIATPATTTRNVSFTMTDGAGAVGDTQFKTASVSNKPALTEMGGNVAWTVGNSPRILAAQAIANDGGNNFANSRLSIRMANGDANDLLTIVSGGGVTISGNTLTVGGFIVGTFTGGSGSSALIVNFNGAATKYAVQTVLRRVAFTNVSSSPATFARSVTFQLKDGTGVGSNVATKSVLV
ncbi:FG-GAP-like repeat-containing protein [Planctomicrobium piriforme]|uniref:FG-GAP-like repeat-containing protein n=1 Tax=Planctomicrobium piriforme TaxID=1576369 RepID=UPI0015873154|nr:FG-GAP-like repeat-containing protein [Planctomicrobium piriforme]